MHAGLSTTEIGVMCTAPTAWYLLCTLAVAVFAVSCHVLVLMTCNMLCDYLKSVAESQC